MLDKNPGFLDSSVQSFLRLSVLVSACMAAIPAV